MRTLLLLLVAALPLLAQNPAKLDSLHRELARWNGKGGYIADTTRYRLYMDLSVGHQGSQPDSAVYYADQAIAIAQRQRDSLREAEALRQKA